VSAPWGDPVATPLEDIRELKRKAGEAWPPPPFQVVLPDWWPEEWPRG
jgi:hypothetical protein